jgi:hypothetical protein
VVRNRATFFFGFPKCKKADVGGRFAEFAI